MSESAQCDHPRVGHDTYWSDLLTIANGLSLIRIALGLSFPWLPSSWRLPVVAVAVLTDLLDGPTARFFGVGNGSGRVLDPLADKVFTAAVVGALLWEGTLTVGETALLGMRDLVVVLGALAGLAFRRWPTFRRMTPTLLGKATTAALFGFFLLLVVAPEYGPLAFPLPATLSTLAGGHYLWLFVTDR